MGPLVERIELLKQSSACYRAYLKTSRDPRTLCCSRAEGSVSGSFRYALRAVLVAAAEDVCSSSYKKTNCICQPLYLEMIARHTPDEVALASSGSRVALRSPCSKLELDGRYLLLS